MMSNLNIDRKQSGAGRDLIMNQEELAAYLDPSGEKITAWTIRTMRIKEGLPYFTAGRRILYRESSVLRWMDEQERAGRSAGKEELAYGIRRVE